MPDAREIPLTKGYFAIVDAADFDWLSQWKWRATGTYRKYATGRESGADVGMHRLLMGAPAGLVVDHINGDPLDNRRANLRVCTDAENVRNSGARRSNLSGYKGVSPDGHRWRARIHFEKRVICVGCFATAEEAARAYDAEVGNWHGEFARLNFPEAA